MRGRCRGRSGSLEPELRILSVRPVCRTRSQTIRLRLAVNYGGRRLGAEVHDCKGFAAVVSLREDGSTALQGAAAWRFWQRLLAALDARGMALL